MVAAGEAGGILDTILKRLATYIEKAAAQAAGQVGDDLSGRDHRRRALMVVVFMLRVIPTFAKMFKASAPSCRCRPVVIWLSDFVRATVLLIIAGVIGCVFAFRAYYATEKGPPHHRRAAAQGAGPRNADPQGRGRALLPHAGDAHVLGRADPRRASTSPPRPPATRSSRTRSCVTRRSIGAARRMAEPLKETGGVPADGHADDRRR